MKFFPGLTFKENVGDIRNTKVVDIINELNEYMVETSIFDPYASAEEVRHEYGLEILPSLDAAPQVDAVILAVPHDKFKEQTGEPCGIRGSKAENTSLRATEPSIRSQLFAEMERRR